MHALCPDMLVGSTSDNLQGVVLGLRALRIQLELPDFGVVCVGTQSIWNVVLNLSSSDVTAYNLKSCSIPVSGQQRDLIGMLAYSTGAFD